MPELMLLNETFDYADGNLETVAGIDAWKTYAIAFGSRSTAVVPVASAKIGGWTSTTRGEAIYQPALAVGSKYTVRLTFTIHNVNSSNQINIWVRENIASPTNNAVVCTLAFGVLNSGSNEEIGISTSNETGIASASFAANTFVAGNSYTLELRVDGNTFSAYLDGIMYCTGTSSNQSAEIGVGFGMSTGSTTLTPAEIDNFVVTTSLPPSAGKTALALWRRHS